MGRATLIDDVERLDGQEELSQITDTDATDLITADAAPAAPTQNDDDVPDKYRGKSVKDIIRMHQEAEKILGRHSSEVGELRKVVDEFIKTQSQPTTAKPAPTPEDDVIDFFADPEKAMARKIESHPAVQQAKQLSEKTHRTEALASLREAHPDMEQILTDARFADWLKESKIRTQLFVQADQNYDTEAASELFSTWKALNGSAKEIVKTEKNDRAETLRRANTGNARGSNDSVSRKKYRRADIIKLMQTDPTRYEALQPEIMAAYQEGRVV